MNDRRRLMEHNCRLMVHNCRSVNYHRGLMIHERCAMNNDRRPMDHDVGTMIDFRRRMIDDWWALNKNSIFLRRVFRFVLFDDRTAVFFGVLFVFCCGNFGLAISGCTLSSKF